MARRVDANQAAIVAALRAAGATVCDLHGVGRGCVDLLVGYQGINYLIEVKSERGKLTPAEVVWLDTWRGQAAIVHDASEAVTVIKSGQDWRKT